MADEQQKPVEQRANCGNMSPDEVKREVTDIRRKLKALMSRLERLENQASRPQAA